MSPTRPLSRLLKPSPALALALVLALVLIAGCASPTAPAPASGPGLGTDVPSTGTAPSLPPPPETRVQPVEETLHGVEIVDPYRWLEDQESPETRAWIDEQNAYTDAVIGDLPLKGSLAAHLTPLLKTDTLGVPTARGERYFYSRRKADDDLPVLYVREGLDGEDRVLLDPHEMSEDHTTSVSFASIAENGERFAYLVREGGVDEVAVRWYDVNRGETLEGGLPTQRILGVELSPDGDVAYYATHSVEEGPRIYRHEVGTDPAGDELLFGGDRPEGQLAVPLLSQDGRWLHVLVLHGSSAQVTEIWTRDLAAEGDFVPLTGGVEARFFPTSAGDTVYLQTTWKAPQGRILAVDLADVMAAGGGDPESFREIVPERDGAVIQGSAVLGDRLAVQTLENVQSRLRLYELDGTPAGEVEFEALGAVGAVAGQPGNDEAFLSFSSFHIPTTIYRYQVSTGERTVWARPDIPVEIERYEVSQAWAPSAKDGTKVPLFLLHEKGLELDGDNPTLITGYGGFALSQTPRFSTTALTWADAGGVYVVAGLRGGAELGEAWHQDGMLANKQNTFDDLYGVAEWLIARGYTRSERLAVMGGSNGGLLVGAAMTQRPELFEAIVCTYPLLDMLRYHQFMVARFWVPEYGSSEDPEQFQWLRAYSPYHNTEPGTEYPAVLFISGDGDSRVAPLHARKMAALMQAAQGDPTQPILLRYHLAAGHSGGQPISEIVDQQAEMLGFLLSELGVEELPTGMAGP